MIARTVRLTEDELVLAYQLSELPTAQHKAGLAGLILHLRSLEERRVEPRPDIAHLDSEQVRVRFTTRSFQNLIDDLYAGYWTEIKVRNKYQNKAPKRVEEVSSKEGGKMERFFVYDDFKPTGNVLRNWLQEGRQSPWLKLWQDMLWSVLRVQPKTRDIYKARADDQSIAISGLSWADLSKFSKEQSRGKLLTKPITGSLFVGAQDSNAEQVPFQGRVDHNLLLHFWPWASPVFVPRAINLRKGQRDYKGYLLVIPEVADLGQPITHNSRLGC